MDRTLRRSQRRAACAPDDHDQALARARRLARAGRDDEARALLRSRLAGRWVDDEVLAGLRPVGPTADRTGSPIRTIARLRWQPGRGLRPVIALVAPRADAAASARALLRAFSEAGRTGRAFRNVRYYRAGGDPVLEFEVALQTPWRPAAGRVFEALRVVSVPNAPAALKVRRHLLRESSVLCAVLDADADAAPTWARLAPDVRRAQGRPLAHVPRCAAVVTARDDAQRTAPLLDLLAQALRDVAGGIGHVAGRRPR